jgi:hypothetical protein
VHFSLSGQGIIRHVKVAITRAESPFYQTVDDAEAKDVLVGHRSPLQSITAAYIADNKGIDHRESHKHANHFLWVQPWH